jgi:hypothetical protein
VVAGPACKNTKKRTGVASIPRLLKKLLFNVSATDPPSFGAVAAGD